MALVDPESRLNFIQSTIQRTPFSSCHSALILENNRQKTLKAELDEIEKYLRTTNDSKTLSNLKDVKIIKEEITANQEALEFFDSISSLEELFSQVTTQIADRALKDSLISTTKDFESDVSFPKVKQCWNRILHYSELTSIHTKDAADYHQFYHECSEIRHFIERRWQLTSKSINRLPLKGVIKDAKEIIKITKETISDLQNLADRINNLKRRSASIVPIYLRTNSIAKQEKKAFLLADFKIGDLQLKKFDFVTILDNWGKNGSINVDSNTSGSTTSRINWLVETKSGDKLLIPSVALWIPGPDSETTLVLNELQNQLIATWEELIEQIREINLKFNCRFMENVLSKAEYSCNNKDLLLNWINNSKKLVIDKNSKTTLVKTFQHNLKTIEQKITVQKEVSESYEGFYIRKQDLILLDEIMIKFMLIEQIRQPVNIKDTNSIRDEWELSIETNLRVVKTLGILQEMQHRNQKELKSILEHIELWKQGSLNVSALKGFTKLRRESQSPELMFSIDSKQQHRPTSSSSLSSSSLSENEEFFDYQNKLSEIKISSVFCNFENTQCTSFDKMYNELFISSANIDKNMELEPQIERIDETHVYKSRKRLQLKPFWDGNNLRITYFEVTPIVDEYSSSDDEKIKVDKCTKKEYEIENETYHANTEIIIDQEKLDLLKSENLDQTKVIKEIERETLKKIETISIKDFVIETNNRNEMPILMNEIHSVLSSSIVSSQTEKLRDIEIFSIKDFVAKLHAQNQIPILINTN